jgi:electron transport complex protein RnfG
MHSLPCWTITPDLKPWGLNEMPDIAKYIIILTLICIVAASVLAGVYTITKEPIAISERQEKLKAIKIVLPPFNNEPDKEEEKITVKDRETEVEKDIYFYPGKNEAGELIGVAIQTVSKTGYGGDIVIMVGADMKGEIQGLYILNYAETPGLGSKIDEEWFKKQFVGISISKNKLSVEKDGGEIDSITGATISSRAVAYAVEEGLEVFKEKYINKQ